jgi:hypothetical protein
MEMASFKQETVFNLSCTRPDQGFQFVHPSLVTGHIFQIGNVHPSLVNGLDLLVSLYLFLKISFDRRSMFMRSMLIKSVQANDGLS